MGKLLLSAKDIREDSDYNEFYMISKQDTADLVRQTEEFLDVITRLVEEPFAKPGSGEN